MSDVLFRYLLMARQRDHSSFRRFFGRHDQWLGAGVEQLVESAAVKITVRSQHERHRLRDVETPASEHHSVKFYDDAEPRPPEPGHFEERTDEFPLRATLAVDTCGSCLGKAETPCGKCRGQGKVACWRCRGSGSEPALGRSGVGRCGSCGGTGKRRCPTCTGSGRHTCARCRGEGETANYVVEIYQWLIEDRAAEEYPLDDPRLVEAFRGWFEAEADQVDSLEPEAAAGHLGFETPESAEVVARADAARRRLEGEARESPDRYLFHHTERWLSPAGYAVVREAGTASYFHLVGRGERAQDVEPGERLDRVKLLGWLGLGGGSLVGWEAAVRLIEAAGPQILDAFQIAAGAPQLGLLGAAVASGALLLSGVRRVLRSPPPVITLGLMPASGEPTPFLTCLAYLGSYTQRLVVLDRIYDTQLERLLGKMRSERQSESLTVELDDGRRVRVIEVARPARLSDEQLELALQALDGVMVLEDERPPGSNRSALALESRLRTIADHLPGARRRVPRIGRLAIDRTGQEGPEDDAVVPLEAIRRAFVEEIGVRSGWNRRFGRIWNPLEVFLSAHDG